MQIKFSFTFSVRNIIHTVEFILSAAKIYFSYHIPEPIICDNPTLKITTKEIKFGIFKLSMIFSTFRKKTKFRVPTEVPTMALCLFVCPS